MSGMGTLAFDIRYAFRMLARNPGFAAIAIVALALGIGVNTAIFTVVNAVLLQPLPYPEPDRVVELDRQFPDGGRGNSISIPKYMVWKDNHVFQAMTLYGFAAAGMNLGAGDRPEQVKTLQVSSGFFQVFGVGPEAGRTFTASEDEPNGPAVAVLTHEMWQSRLGGEQRIVGRPVLLNGQPYTVLGILPKGFHSEAHADVFLPLQADPQSTNQGHYLNVAARMKPGVTLSSARAEMKIAGERFRKDNPKWMDKAESVAVTPMREATVGDIKTALLVLLGAVGFVLLIACANVANLLLARAAVRQREMAVRAAVGAGRWRVVRQLLTESVLLAGIGGAMGYALGSWGVRALLLLVPADIPRLMDADGVRAVAPPLDWRVAAFTLAAALLTGILFGLIPALQASKLDLVSALKEAGNRSGTSRRHNRARSSSGGRRSGAGAGAGGGRGAAHPHLRRPQQRPAGHRPAQCPHHDDLALQQRLFHHRQGRCVHNCDAAPHRRPARRGGSRHHGVPARGQLRDGPAVQHRGQASRQGRPI